MYSIDAEDNKSPDTISMELHQQIDEKPNTLFNPGTKLQEHWEELNKNKFKVMMFPEHQRIMIKEFIKLSPKALWFRSSGKVLLRYKDIRTIVLGKVTQNLRTHKIVADKGDELFFSIIYKAALPEIALDGRTGFRVVDFGICRRKDRRQIVVQIIDHMHKRGIVPMNGVSNTKYILENMRSDQQIKIRFERLRNTKFGEYGIRRDLEKYWPLPSGLEWMDESDRRFTLKEVKAKLRELSIEMAKDTVSKLFGPIHVTPSRVPDLPQQSVTSFRAMKGTHKPRSDSS